VALGNWLGFGFGEHWVAVGLTVAFALVGVVAWGTLMGALFPVFLKRLGADPATSSAPLVATLIDGDGKGSKALLESFEMLKG
jgi:Mg/Co/Ni transporter MgtE